MFKSGKRRAPTLYLQADNCFKENKNKFVLAFCALLVLIGWFHDVYLSFLPKGHTHEDIDQLFSVLRKSMSREDYDMLAGLVNLVHRVYTAGKRPDCIIQPPLLDVKSWLRPFIRLFEGHSGPHAFHFARHTEEQNVRNLNRFRIAFTLLTTIVTENCHDIQGLVVR
jgi:hypothetical protein